MSTARRILSNTAVQVFGKLIIAVFGVISVKYITSYLGPETYGKYTIIFEYLAFWGIFADMGLFTIGVREMSRTPKQVNHILTQLIVMRMILASSVLILALGISYLMPGYSDLIRMGILFGGLAMIFTFLAGTLSTSLQVQLRMEKATIALVLGKMTTVGYVIYAVSTGMPFMHLIYAGLFGSILTLFITTHFVSKNTNFVFQIDWIFIKKILREALPYGIAIILGTIYFRLGSLMIFHFHGARDTGIYGIALKILEFGTIIPVFFLNSTLPTITKILNKEKHRTDELIHHALNFLFFVGMGIAAFAIVLSPSLIILLSSVEFISAVIPMQILMVAMFFYYLNLFFSYLLVAVNKQKYLLYFNLVAVIVNFAANYILISKIGTIGAAISAVITEMLIMTCTLIASRGIIKYTFPYYFMIRIAFAAILSAGLVWQIRDMALYLTIPASAILYIGILKIIGGIDQGAIDMVRKKI